MYRQKCYLSGKIYHKMIKTESCHDANFAVTCGTGAGRYSDGKVGTLTIPRFRLYMSFKCVKICSFNTTP